MKIGIFWDHLTEMVKQTGMPLPEVLSDARNCGIGYVEVNADDVPDGAAFRQMLAQYDLRVGGMYCRFDFGHSNQAEKRRSVLSKAKAADAACIMAVPGFVQPGEDRIALQKAMAEQMRALCSEAKTQGAPFISMEDYDDCNAPYGTIEELNRFLREVPEVSVAFDTGNFLYFHQDAREAYRLLGARVRHVHLKDIALTELTKGDVCRISAEGQNQYPAPAGSGVIPLADLLRQMKKDGYNGIYAIEHFDAVNLRDYMHRSAEWLQALAL